MKRVFILISTIIGACIAFVACTQEIDADKLQSFDNVQQPSNIVGQKITITATVEDNIPDTKTVLLDHTSAAGLFNWTPGDEINLIFGSGSGSRFSTPQSFVEPSPRAAFEGLLPAAIGVEEGSEADLKFWGIFPYNESNSVVQQDGKYYASVVFPAEQTAFDYDEAVANSWDLGPFGSWGKDQFPYLAQSGNLLLTFKMIGGGIKFFVRSSGIKEIHLRGANNEIIAGEFLVTMNSSGNPVIESYDSPVSSSEIILRAPDNGTFKASTGDTKYFYYFSLPAITFANGITITAYTEDSRGTRVVTNSLTVPRKGLPGWQSTPIDNDAMVWFDNTPANRQISYTASEAINPSWGDITFVNEYNQTTGEGVLTFDEIITEIPYRAFFNQTGLEEIVLPECLITIRVSAFEGCANLTSVTVGSGQTMGSNIKTISDQAFLGCSALTDVVLPSALEYLGHAAFADCIGLTTIDIPESVTLQSNMNNPFWGCTGITSFSGKYATSDGLFLVVPNSNGTSNGLVSTALGAPALGPDRTCVLPELNISYVSTFAMAGLKAKVLVLLTNPITGLGTRCIEGATNLQSIELPETINSIGFNAFNNCNNLNYVAFTGDVLPNYFQKYQNLSFDVRIPGFSTVQSSQALSNDYWQYYINSNRLIVYQDDDEVWYHTTDNSTVNVSENTYFGAESNVIGSGTFNPHSLHPNAQYVLEAAPGSLRCDFIQCTPDVQIGVVKVANKVFEVPMNVFTGNTAIDYVSLPSTVQRIGANAFKDCTNLQMFPLEYNCTSLIAIDFFAFSGCTNMTFPHSNFLDMRRVSNLGAGAFQGCESFGSRIESTSFIFLGQISYLLRTFTNCKQLTHILFYGPDGQLTDDAVHCIKDVGEQSFMGCEKLTTINSAKLRTPESGNYINLPGIYIHSDGYFGYVGESAFEGCKSIKEVHLGAAKIFEDRAFYDCQSLHSITLDTQNLTEVGDNAFEKCINLTKIGGVNDPDGVVLPNVTTVGGYAFSQCIHITSASLSNVTEIGRATFTACSALLSVDLPQLTDIPRGCFYNCLKLQNVNIPAARTIGIEAFYNCKKLAALTFPLISTISDKAFSGTNELSSLKLGPSLTSLGNNLFDANTNSGLMNIYFAGAVPSNITNAFVIGTGSTHFTFQTIYTLSQYSNDYATSLGASYGPISTWNGVF